MIGFLMGIVCCMALDAQTATTESNYLFEEFKQGSVKFKNKAPAQALLNYDMLLQEMQFMQGENVMILQELNTIDTIFIEGRKFIPQRNVFLEKIETGSTTFFVEWKITVLSKLKEEGVGIISQMGATDALNVSHTQKTGAAGETRNIVYNFKYNNSYYLPKGGKLLKFSTTQGFVKLFPKDKTSAIQAFISDNKVNIQHVGDVQSLIEYANNLVK